MEESEVLEAQDRQDLMLTALGMDQEVVTETAEVEVEAEAVVVAEEVAEE